MGLAQFETGYHYAQDFNSYLARTAARMGLTLDDSLDVIDAFALAVNQAKDAAKKKQVEDSAKERDQTQTRMTTNASLIAAEVQRFAAQVQNYRNQANAKLGGKMAKRQQFSAQTLVYMQ